MRTLLKDTLEYQTVPFLVKVEQKEMYIKGETGQVRGVNGWGSPSGMETTQRDWVLCDCLVATVRPDYPYTIDEEWPENVDKHFHEVEPLEFPKKSRKLLILNQYEKVKIDPSRDAEQMAEDAIESMKEAYKNRDRVATLT